MAEFQEVIKQFKRLRDLVNQDCPSCGFGNMSFMLQDIVDNSVEFEKRVMSWAAEHPEPVYPTWGTWLANKYDFDLREIMYTPIPADLAQRLGIEPKEC